MTKQLTLFENVIEPQKSSITDVVIEPENKALQRYLSVPAKKVECSVNQYESSKCNRFYYRVSWRKPGGKPKHLHIPGGSTISKLAQYRAGKLQEMIDRGADLQEIIAAVETYSSKRN